MYVVRLFPSFLVFSVTVPALGACLLFRWVCALACSWIRSTGVSYCLWADCSVQTWALLAPSSGPFRCLPDEPGSSRRPGPGQSCLLVSFLTAPRCRFALWAAWLEEQLKRILLRGKCLTPPFCRLVLYLGRGVSGLVWWVHTPHGRSESVAAPGDAPQSTLFEGSWLLSNSGEGRIGQA